MSRDTYRRRRYLIVAGQPRACRLSGRNGEHFHDFDAFSREDCEVRVAKEQLGSSFLSVGRHDDKGGHIVSDVADAGSGSKHCFAQRATHFQNAGCMHISPFLPCRDALSLPSQTLVFSQSLPRSYGSWIPCKHAKISLRAAVPGVGRCVGSDACCEGADVTDRLERPVGCLAWTY